MDKANSDGMESARDRAREYLWGKGFANFLADQLLSALTNEEDEEEALEQIIAKERLQALNEVWAIAGECKTVEEVVERVAEVKKKTRTILDFGVSMFEMHLQRAQKSEEQALGALKAELHDIGTIYVRETAALIFAQNPALEPEAAWSLAARLWDANPSHGMVKKQE